MPIGILLWVLSSYKTHFKIKNKLKLLTYIVFFTTFAQIFV